MGHHGVVGLLAPVLWGREDLDLAHLYLGGRGFVIRAAFELQQSSLILQHFWILTRVVAIFGMILRSILLDFQRFCLIFLTVFFSRCMISCFFFKLVVSALPKP